LQTRWASFHSPHWGQRTIPGTDSLKWVRRLRFRVLDVLLKGTATKITSLVPSASERVNTPSILGELKFFQYGQPGVDPFGVARTGFPVPVHTANGAESLAILPTDRGVRQLEQNRPPNRSEERRVGEDNRPV